MHILVSGTDDDRVDSHSRRIRLRWCLHVQQKLWSRLAWERPRVFLHQHRHRWGRMRWSAKCVQVNDNVWNFVNYYYLSSTLIGCRCRHANWMKNIKCQKTVPKLAHKSCEILKAVRQNCGHCEGECAHDRRGECEWIWNLARWQRATAIYLTVLCGIVDSYLGVGEMANEKIRKCPALHWEWVLATVGVRVFGETHDGKTNLEHGPNSFYVTAVAPFNHTISKFNPFNDFLGFLSLPLTRLFF